MGKLAVVFFAALAFHAALGGLTKGFGYEHEELNDLVRQVVTVSNELCGIFHGTTLTRGFSWETREFGEDLDEVILLLEQLTSKHEERTTEMIFNIVHELRELRMYWKELRSTSDATTMRRLEVSMAAAMKKIVKHIETFHEIFSEEEFSRIFHVHFMTALKKYMFALTRLLEHVNTRKSYNMDFKNHWQMNEYRTETNIHNIVRELEVVLERVHIEDITMKRAFMFFVRSYLESLREVLTPEFHQYYDMFFHKKDSTYSVQEIKTHLYTFLKKFSLAVEHMPGVANLSFVKATRKLWHRLEVMSEINTPARQMSLRVQAVADLLLNWYENTPFESHELKQLIHKHAQQLVEVLRRFVSKLKQTEAHPEFVSNMKRLIVALENEVTMESFVVLIHEATTEVRKFLMHGAHTPEMKIYIGTEYIDALESLKNNFRTIGVSTNVELWSNYMMATMNRLSMYMQNDINSEDYRMLMKRLNMMMELLEKKSHPEYKKFSRVLKERIREFETEGYMINNFLQNISLQINQFIYTVYEQENRMPKSMMEIVEIYTVTLEEIFINQRVVQGLVAIQTPTELTLHTHVVVDRVNEILNLMIPGFKVNRVANRVHYFNQILEIVMFRLRKMTSGYETSDVLVKKVYENLREIRNHLHSVLERTDLNTKVNFGVYIQNAFMELQRLAFERPLEKNMEFFKLYGDFFYGMEYILNQLQFDLQVVNVRYPMNTLFIQMGTYGDRISHFLEHMLPKPEMKRVLLLQAEALSQEVEYIANELKKIGNNKLFTELGMKYTKMYHELYEIVEKGWNRSHEELCMFLDVQVRTIVRDFRYLMPYTMETSELYDLYKSMMIQFSNIMARLENVHYYEYYQIIVNTPDFGKFVRRLTSRVASKLERPIAETKEIKYDLAYQTMRFTRRLIDVALRFQLEARVQPKGLYHIIFEIHRVAKSESVTVRELTHVLNKSIVALYKEIEEILHREGLVGTENALIRYIRAVEFLNFGINDVLMRGHNEENTFTNFRRADMHMHYLIWAIEHVTIEDKQAFEILRNEYHHLVQFVQVLLTKFHKMDVQITRFQHLQRYENIDELEVNMIEALKYTLAILKEMSWRMEYQGTDLDINSYLEEFLVTIHRTYLTIESNILHPYRMHLMNKWGLIFEHPEQYHYVNNKYSNKYNEEYYGPIVKYFNKGYKYSDDYAPQYKRYGLGSWNKLEGHNWEQLPETFNTEWRHSKMFDHIPEEFKYTDMRERNWEVPEHLQIVKYEHPTTYKHDSMKFWQRDEKPHFFGKYETEGDFEFPIAHGLELPMYMRQNKYETKETTTLMKDIKMIARKVVEELTEVTMNMKSMNVYVRELTRIVDHTIIALEEENTKTGHIIEVFQQIKEELLEIVNFRQPGQVRYRLTNAIEQIVDQFERIAHIEQFSGVELFKDIFAQFFSYIRNVRYQIKNMEFERPTTEFYSHGFGKHNVPEYMEVY